MNSVMIHLLTHASNTGYMDKWTQGVSVLCADCSWMQHNVGWPGATFGTGTGIFNASGNFPPRPPDFPNWSPDQQHQWRHDTHLPNIPQWINFGLNWGVHAVGGGTETNRANGGAPDVDSSGLRCWGTQGGQKG